MARSALLAGQDDYRIGFPWTKGIKPKDCINEQEVNDPEDMCEDLYDDDDCEDARNENLGDASEGGLTKRVQVAINQNCAKFCNMCKAGTAPIVLAVGSMGESKGFYGMFKAKTITTEPAGFNPKNFYWVSLHHITKFLEQKGMFGGNKKFIECATGLCDTGTSKYLQRFMDSAAENLDGGKLLDGQCKTIRMRVEYNLNAAFTSLDKAQVFLSEFEDWATKEGCNNDDKCRTSDKGFVTTCPTSLDYGNPAEPGRFRFSSTRAQAKKDDIEFGPTGNSNWDTASTGISELMFGLAIKTLSCIGAMLFG